MRYLMLLGLLTATAMSSPQLANADNMDNKPLASYEENAYVTLTGTASNVTDHHFKLNYGRDTVTVEMEDWDWDMDTNLKRYISEGEKVAVSGQVEDSWFSDREIEADNIYLEDDAMYLYVYDVNPAYETYEDNRRAQNMERNSERFEDGSFITSTGKVENTMNGGFELRTSGQVISVDTSEMISNPINSGLIEKGDRVRVSGLVDDDFFTDKEIVADTVTAYDKVDAHNKDGRYND